MAAVRMPGSARDTLAQLLNESAQDQPEVARLTEQQTLAHGRILQASQAKLLHTVAACLVQADSGAEAFPVAKRTPLSPFLKPLPAPPMDDEVHALESQVTAACQRIAELRSTVPKQLAQQLSQHLQQCRPADTATNHSATAETTADAQLTVGASHSQESADQQIAAVNSAHLKPAPSELQDMYMTATQKMPALRAKLGEALERMDRVVQAIEQDAVQPSPYTVQLATHLQQANTNSVSPALQQALQTGQVTTRKAVSSNEVNPVPFAI